MSPSNPSSSPRGSIDRLIINSPYEEPARHWRYERETRLFDLLAGRRPAGYVVATPGSKAFDDPGVFVPIPLVNQIRPRVKAWRQSGYPGISSLTKRLLERRVGAGVEVPVLQGLGERLHRTEVAVVALAFARDRGVDGVVDVVVPLRRQTETAGLPGGHQPRVVQV